MINCKIAHCKRNAKTVVVWGCLNMHVSTVPYCAAHAREMMSHAVRCSSCYEPLYVDEALHTDIGNVNEVFLGNDSHRQVQ